MERSLTFFLFFFLLIVPFTVNTYAANHFGVNFSYPIVKKEPPALKGFQIMFNYDPDRFKWRKFNVYFDGGFSHFNSHKLPYYTSINIYSLAPVVRYSFRRVGSLLPFLELSIGIAYLNHTRLDHRNLGIHFAFQDRMGVGVFIGSSKRFSLGIHSVHYSNAHLSSHNSGITVPLSVDLGYRFP